MSKSLPVDFFSGSLPIALVAGGAGFVGSHVCENLLDRSVKVICLDNWQTGVKENINHLLLNKNFLLLENDVADEISSRIKRVDYVLHLAGVEAYLNGEDVSIETLEANSIGSKNLLDLAEKNKARFLLASTIYVYSAKISKDSTLDYFGETREEEGEFSQLEAKRFAEALASEYGQKRGVDTRVVRLGDVYGPRMMIATNNILSRLIKQACYKEHLLVHGGQEIHLYPVFIDDVVDGIIKSLFSGGTRNSIVSLAGAKTSLFTLAQTIKSVSPEELEISFASEGFPKVGLVEEAVLRAGKNLVSWEAGISLQEGMKRTLDWFSYHHKYLPKTTNQQKQKEVEKKESVIGISGVFGNMRKFVKKVRTGPQKTEAVKTVREEKGFWNDKKTLSKETKKPRFIISALLLLVLIYFFAFPVLLLYLGIGQLYLFKSLLTKGDFENAQKWARWSGYVFGGAEAGFSQWFKIPGLKNESVRYVNKSRAFEKFAIVAVSSTQTFDATAKFIQSVLSTQGADQSLIQNTAMELKNLSGKIGFLETELSSHKIVLSVPMVRNELFQKSGLENFRRAALNLSGLVSKSNDLLGVDQKKMYLVLFVDNKNLRPGGGLIKSYALLTYDQGKLTNVDVQPVGSADGQLKGEVEPPQSIKNYLGETKWLLKDANWSPDFPTSAKQAAWFVNKEVGVNIDGVVGIDYEFVRNLLDEVGAVNIDDFNVSVDSENLYKVAENMAGGTQKDFSTSLLREVLKIATESPKNNLLPLAKSSISSLDNKHMVVWMNNSTVGQILSQAGWDGSIKQISCKTDLLPGCVDDYLQISEVDTTKAGYPNKNYSLELFPSNEKISHRLLISYESTGMDYKGYVRVLVPKSSQATLLSIIDSSKQIDLKIEEGLEKNKKTLGFLIDIPSGTKRQVILMWDVPNIDLSKSKVAGDSTQGHSTLEFLWQKQIGTLDDPVSLRVNLPDNSSVVSSFPIPSLTTGDVVGYNTNLSRDLTTSITWQQKK